jgi:hypothetical protein
MSFGLLPNEEGHYVERDSEKDFVVVGLFLLIISAAWIGGSANVYHKGYLSPSHSLM